MSFFDSAVEASTSRSGRPVRERLGISAALFVVVALAAVIGGGWWLAHRHAEGHFAPGTEVAGVSIGGLDHADAVARLRSDLPSKLDRPIRVTTSVGTTTVDPTAAGLGVDYAATLRQAGLGVGWRPDEMWQYFTGDQQLSPVLAVDRRRLRTQAAAVVHALAEPSRDATVSFVGGAMRVHAARSGEGLDPADVSTALERAYAGGDDSAVVPLRTVGPRVSDQAVHRAIARYVNPALASPVTLRLGTHRVVLRPASYGDALTLVPRHGRLRLGVDRDVLMRLVGPAVDRAPQPVNASVRLVGGQPSIVPGRRGRSYSAAAVEQAFLHAATARGARRSVSVPSLGVTPQVTASDVRRFGITQPVARFTVRSPGISPAQLHRQVQAADGTVVRPGGAYSLRRVLSGSDNLGDLTPLATAVYNAAYLSGLSDRMHLAPSVHVSGYPLGREATLGSRGGDLRLGNDTPHGVWVHVTTSGGRLTASLWSTRVWQVSTRTTCRVLGGGTAQVRNVRTFTRPGSATADHTDQEETTYPSLSPSVCRGVTARAGAGPAGTA